MLLFNHSTTNVHLFLAFCYHSVPAYMLVFPNADVLIRFPQVCGPKNQNLIIITYLHLKKNSMYTAFLTRYYGSFKMPVFCSFKNVIQRHILIVE